MKSGFARLDEHFGIDWTQTARGNVTLSQPRKRALASQVRAQRPSPSSGEDVKFDMGGWDGERIDSAA